VSFWPRLFVSDVQNVNFYRHTAFSWFLALRNILHISFFISKIVMVLAVSRLFFFVYRMCIEFGSFLEN